MDWKNIDDDDDEKDNIKQEVVGGMNTESITIKRTRSQRRRIHRKIQRMWASSGGSALRRNSRGRPGPSALEAAPSAKLVGRVPPMKHRDDAPSDNGLPSEFYTPSAEVFIHPSEIKEVRKTKKDHQRKRVAAVPTGSRRLLHAIL